MVLEIPFTELRYWFILFSCSCFANMLGLNISSAFNSAVTIYILIPVLVIPQLLLSGVVINFDKFNPSVGKPVGVPLIGELMASRWAFEAYMVTQFKDNPFEKQFYELDKIIALSEYKRVYYIPQLESKLAYCFNEHVNSSNRQHEELKAALNMLQREVQSELRWVGEGNFPEINRLQIGMFDYTVHQATSRFLTVLKQYYNNRMNKAVEEKEKKIAEMTNTPARKDAFEKFKNTYVNSAVTDAVKNVSTPVRIIEFKGNLVQRIYPGYQDEHKPAHFLDFSANLSQPTKYFAGRTFDTLVFNLAVIWFMTGILFVTLYFEVLQWIITFFERRRKYRMKKLND
jgi:hypothetical protein